MISRLSFLLVLIVAHNAAAAEVERVIDITIGAQLDGIHCVERATVVYGAYPWREISDDYYTTSINAAADVKHRYVMLDYEKNSAGTPVPIDPIHDDHFGIVQQHQNYARSIKHALPAAQEHYVHLGIFRFLALTWRNVNRIVHDYPNWRAEQERVLELHFNEDNETLLDVIQQCNGHVWVPYYLPTAWVNDPTFDDNAKDFWTNLKTTYDDLEVPHVPVIQPIKTSSNLWQWQLDNLGPVIAVWAKAGEVPQAYKDLLE